MKNESVLKGNAFFEKYIRKHFLKYIIVLAIYIVGFLGGIIFFNQTVIDNEEAEQISQYVIEGIDTLKVENSNVIGNYIKEDFWEFIIIMVLSFSLIGVPIIFLMLFIKSVSIGITVSSLIFAGGAGYGLSFSILIFMIPVMLKILMSIILLCSSLKLLENILKYQKEMKYEMVRHAFTILITFLVFCGLILYRVFSLNLINNILI